jgi:cell wall-associated NlpC family hydrolase
VTGIIQRCTLICLLLLAAFPRPSGGEDVYTVRKGDTLSRVARWNGVTAEALVEANGLASDRLMPGMQLRIPPRQGDPESAAVAPAPAAAVSPDESAARGPEPQETRSHTVEKGETLSSIAGLYGMSVKELKALNRIRKAGKLRAGKDILVFKPAEPAPEETATVPPAAVVPESRLAREIRELTESLLVKEVRELSEPVAGTGGIKEKLIRIAKKMLDIPYRFGGSSFRGIDCSGYVQKVFSLLNIVLPRTAREQFHRGTLVDRDDLSIGDLVFFRTYAKFPSHVGIYLGDNRFIHASSTDRKVTIDSLDAPYYIKRFVGARRLPLDEPVGEI